MTDSRSRMNMPNSSRSMRILTRSISRQMIAAGSLSVGMLCSAEFLVAAEKEPARPARGVKITEVTPFKLTNEFLTSRKRPGSDSFVQTELSDRAETEVGNQVETVESPAPTPKEDSDSLPPVIRRKPKTEAAESSTTPAAPKAHLAPVIRRTPRTVEQPQPIQVQPNTDATVSAEPAVTGPAGMTLTERAVFFGQSFGGPFNVAPASNTSSKTDDVSAEPMPEAVENAFAPAKPAVQPNHTKAGKSFAPVIRPTRSEFAKPTESDRTAPAELPSVPATEEVEPRLLAGIEVKETPIAANQAPAKPWAAAAAARTDKKAETPADFASGYDFAPIESFAPSEEPVLGGHFAPVVRKENKPDDAVESSEQRQAAPIVIRTELPSLRPIASAAAPVVPAPSASPNTKALANRASEFQQSIFKGELVPQAEPAEIKAAVVKKPIQIIATKPAKAVSTPKPVAFTNAKPVKSPAPVLEEPKVAETIPAASIPAETNRQTAKTLELSVHATRRIQLPAEIKAIQVSNNSLCEALQLSPSELVVLGKSAGNTTLRISLSNGVEQVHKVQIQPSVEKSVVDGSVTTQLKGALIEKFPGREVDLKSDRNSIVVSGIVSDAQEAIQIVAFVRANCLVPVVDRLEVPRSTINSGR